MRPSIMLPCSFISHVIPILSCATYWCSGGHCELFTTHGWGERKAICCSDESRKPTTRTRKREQAQKNTSTQLSYWTQESRSKKAKPGAECLSRTFLSSTIWRPSKHETSTAFKLILTFSPPSQIPEAKAFVRTELVAALTPAVHARGKYIVRPHPQHSTIRRLRQSLLSTEGAQSVNG